MERLGLYGVVRMIAASASVAAVVLVLAPSLRAQILDDPKRKDLESKVAALQPLACVTPTVPPDPQVTALKSVLDAYAQQYGAVLDAQIQALNAGQVPNINADDQKLLAVSRQAKRDALGKICEDTARKLFGAVRGADGTTAPAPAKPASPAASLELTPSVARAAETEVSEKAETSVTIKNTGNDPVSLGEPRVCDGSPCHERTEIFQVGDGAIPCKNPLGRTDHCELKITFTPHHAYRYRQFLQIPVKSAAGLESAPLEIPLEGTGFVPNIAHVQARAPSASHPSMRAVTGFDISGTTGSDTHQNLFVEFALNAPFGRRDYTVCVDAKGKSLTDSRHTLIADVQAYDKTYAKGTVVASYDACQALKSKEDVSRDVRYAWIDRHADPLESRTWWFFNPRIASVPQQPTALSNFNVQGITDNLTSKTSGLVQGIDVQGGIEYMLIKPREGLAFFSSYKNAKARIGMAWVLGAGFASPFSAVGNNPTVFTLADNSPLRPQFSVPAFQPGSTTAKFTNIAFVNLERSRFFRRYYTGLRLKTYQFSKAYISTECDAGYPNECEGVYNAYPGIADITVGKDEQVTAGHLSGWLFRLDVAFPLPFVPGLHTFGSVESSFQKNQNTDPLFLPATSATPISDPSVFLVKVPLRNRDVYRLGFGVDLLQVINQARQAGKKNVGGSGTSTEPPPGGATGSTAPTANGQTKKQ